MQIHAHVPSWMHAHTQTYTHVCIPQQVKEKVLAEERVERAEEAKKKSLKYRKWEKRSGWKHMEKGNNLTCIV